MQMYTDSYFPFKFSIRLCNMQFSCYECFRFKEWYFIIHNVLRHLRMNESPVDFHLFHRSFLLKKFRFACFKHLKYLKYFFSGVCSNVSQNIRKIFLKKSCLLIFSSHFFQYFSNIYNTFFFFFMLKHHIPNFQFWIFSPKSTDDIWMNTLTLFSMFHFQGQFIKNVWFILNRSKQKEYTNFANIN